MAAKKTKTQGPNDRKIADCVVGKFKKCVDDAISEGKPAENALQGCKKNITLFSLLCRGGSTTASLKKRSTKTKTPTARRAARQTK